MAKTITKFLATTLAFTSIVSIAQARPMMMTGGGSGSRQSEQLAPARPVPPRPIMRPAPVAPPVARPQTAPAAPPVARPQTAPVAPPVARPQTAPVTPPAAATPTGHSAPVVTPKKLELAPKYDNPPVERKDQLNIPALDGKPGYTERFDSKGVVVGTPSGGIAGGVVVEDRKTDKTYIGHGQAEKGGFVFDGEIRDGKSGKSYQLEIHQDAQSKSSGAKGSVTNQKTGTKVEIELEEGPHGKGGKGTVTLPLPGG